MLRAVMHIVPYLQQMEQAAREVGVDLAEACKKEGVAATTLMRWRNGTVNPREATTEAILKRIAVIAAERQQREDEFSRTGSHG